MTTIDLHLPTSWNACTTADLEAIAAAIIHEQQRTDRYHPFDWSRVKLAVVLSINAVAVLGGGSGDGRVPPGSVGGSGDEWLVQRPQDKEPWPVTTGQLLALTERLAWLDDEKANKTIFQFPYPELDVRCKKEEGRLLSHHCVPHSDLQAREPSSITHLLGPAPMLDGYTWQEYRYLTDWMQEYMRRTNALLQAYGNDRQAAAIQAADAARNEFLAVLFKPASRVVAGLASDNPANREPLTLNPESFASFDPVKWQVILFWWSSLMALLQQKFPRVFKPQPVGRGRQQKKNETPWDFYNRVTATIQKYIGGLSEADVNAATYGTILQQLDMMAQEAAELERVKARHS